MLSVRLGVPMRPDDSMIRTILRIPCGNAWPRHSGLRIIRVLFAARFHGVSVCDPPAALHTHTNTQTHTHTQILASVTWIKAIPTKVSAHDVCIWHDSWSNTNKSILQIKAKPNMAIRSNLTCTTVTAYTRQYSVKNNFSSWYRHVHSVSIMIQEQGAVPLPSFTLHLAKRSTVSPWLPLMTSPAVDHHQSWIFLHTSDSWKSVTIKRIFHRKTLSIHVLYTFCCHGCVCRKILVRLGTQTMCTNRAMN